MSDRLRAEFDVARACEEIRALNRSSLFSASDYLVAKEFAPYEVLSDGQATRAILLIDGLWATQLFRERGGPERMLRLYQRNGALYRDRLPQLQGVTLEDNPDEVYQIAADLLGTLLDREQPGRQHYSFATKLFHWHAPEHLPIVDSRARKAINTLQKACGQRHDVVLSSIAEMLGETYVEEYGRWVRFYGALIRSLTSEDRERLLAADHESLEPEFELANSLLRVLDKIFYHRGGRV